MAKIKPISYISITIQAVISLLLFVNLMVSVYAITSPGRITRKKISKLSYGAIKVEGEIKGTTYGQVNFSTVNLHDGTGSVTILFGLYKNIEDPVLAQRRKKLKDVSGMSRERAIAMLNKPVHYKSIEVVGVYYPFLGLAHAYYINGQITVVEFLMLFMYIALTAFFFYSTILSMMTARQK